MKQLYRTISQEFICQIGILIFFSVQNLLESIKRFAFRCLLRRVRDLGEDEQAKRCSNKSRRLIYHFIAMQLFSQTTTTTTTTMPS